LRPYEGDELEFRHYERASGKARWISGGRSAISNIAEHYSYHINSWSKCLQFKPGETIFS